jgi:aminopeptidase N
MPKPASLASWLGRRFVPLFFFLLLLVPALSSARQQAQTELPADLSAFLAQAQTALKAGDNDTLRALAEAPDTLSWLGTRSRRARTSGWSLAALSLPTPNAEYLTVFYDFHTCESIGDHVHRLVKADGGWRFGAEIPETDTRGYRVRDHKLNVRYDLPRAGCTITDDATIERIGPATEPCLLRLSSDMTVDSITMGGKPFSYRCVPGLIVFLPPTSGKTFTLSLAYHGTVNHPGSDYIRDTEAVLVSYWYPHIARLPAKHGVTVTVPKGWTAIGEGELLRREERGDSLVFTYRNVIPTCYFSLDAGPYVLTTQEVNGRKLSACQLRPNAERAATALDRLIRALDFFEKAFGPFPYTHYEMVETLGPFGGALEAYSFATFGGGAFGANVHELAHTWWGGIVPCPYTKSMWNESFASYSDGLFNRQTAKERPARALRGQHGDAEHGRLYLRWYTMPMATAFDTENGSHSAVGYGKGSIVLAMLEDLLGTETMLRCMRRFRADLKPGEAADWLDFERAVRKTTGKDYGWFFDQWVNRSGLPVVRLADAQVAHEGDEFVVTARIVQEGETYRLPRVPVALELDGGQTVREEVEIAGADIPIRLTSKTAPRALLLDPDGNILMAGAKMEDDKANPFSFRFEEKGKQVQVSARPVRLIGGWRRFPASSFRPAPAY